MALSEVVALETVSVRVCVSVAHLCTERERGAFHVDPREFGFLLTEDLCLSTFSFTLAIPHCQDFNIFWKHVICLAISVC